MSVSNRALYRAALSWLYVVSKTDAEYQIIYTLQIIRNRSGRMSMAISFGTGRRWMMPDMRMSGDGRGMCSLLMRRSCYQT